MSDHDHTTENWLGLVEFPGYDVSDQGRVRSYWHTLGYRYGMAIGETTKFLKLIRNEDGYLEVNLKHRSGKIKTRGVHLLVLQAFKGLKEPGQVGRHLNDDKSNNRTENLEWGSLSENRRDLFRNGYKHPSGEAWPGPRWSDAVRTIAIELFESGISVDEIVERLKIPQTSVWRFINKHRKG